MEKINLSQQAVSALEQGSKIAAIKIVREEQNLGLKEAKELVEKFLEQNPLINERLQTGSSSGLPILLVIVAAIAITLYYFINNNDLN